MVEVELEHVGRFEEVGEWMALRRFDTREVRGHRSCPIHAVVVWYSFHFFKLLLFIYYSVVSNVL